MPIGNILSFVAAPDTGAKKSKITDEEEVASDNYTAYVNACKESGYIVVDEDSDTYYQAYTAQESHKK